MQFPLFDNNEINGSPKNERDAVLYYLSKMDIEMLELIMDEKRTYQEASKEVFLEKLDKSFLEFTKKGDTELKVLKGECNNDRCHKGCIGYAFIGNCSGFHLDLIVEEANNKILDMWNCSDFKAYAEKLDENKKVNIDILPDEQASFKPSESFLITAHQCAIAIEEIIQNDFELPVVNMQIAEQWLEKQEELFESIDPFLIPAAYSKFKSLYYSISFLVRTVNQKVEAERGLRFYYKRVKKSKNEQMLLCWLVEFEKLKDVLYGLRYYYPDYNVKKKIDYVKIDSEYDIYINPEDAVVQLKFLRIYNNYYNKILEKYSIVPEDTWEIEENWDAYENRDSLKYHLQQRGIL